LVDDSLKAVKKKFKKNNFISFSKIKKKPKIKIPFFKV